MAGTLFISDLDGTLLSPEAKLTEYAAGVLNRVSENGGDFTIATARTMVTAGRIMENVKITAPMVSMNGVAVFDPKKQEFVRVEYMEKDDVSYTADVIRRCEASAMLYALCGGELETYYETLESSALESFIEERRNGFGKKFFRRSFSDLPYDNVIYFTLLDTYDKLSPVKKALETVPGLNTVLYSNVYTENQWFLEIYSSKASKGSGARFAAESRGYDRVIGFGDNLNDLPLFEACDVKVAVENAVDELKAQADFICRPNHEDGVARWIEENMQEKGHGPE